MKSLEVGKKILSRVGEDNVREAYAIGVAQR